MTVPSKASPPRRVPTHPGVQFAAWLRRESRVGAVALAAVAVLTVVLSLWLENASRWVGHSREVARTARRAVVLADDRETGLRGYLLTRDSLFLDPELAARAPLAATLDRLVVLTADNPSQQARARASRAAVERWAADFAAPVLDGSALGRSALDPADARAFLLRGKHRFDRIRLELGAFVAAEDGLYRERADAERVVRWTTAAATLLGLALLALVLVRFRRELARQGGALLAQQDDLRDQAAALARELERSHEQAEELRAQQQQLEEQATELEHQVSEARIQGDALEAANDQLGEALDLAHRAQLEARRARDEWQSLGSRLEFVLDSSPFPIAIVGKDRRVELRNPAFATLSGAGMPVRGAALASSIPALAGVVDPLVERVLDGGAGAAGVEIVVPPAVWSASVYPVRTGAGQLLGAGVVLVDLSEQRRLETELRQAQRMEAIGRLTGGIAHDFNNILTAVSGFSEMALARLEPGSRTHGDVEQVQRAAARATALTRQLLAFSRQQVLQPKVMDVNEVVSSVDALLRRLLGADVDLVTRLDPALWAVRADPGQLEQVLMNLAVNARDAMPDGGRLVVETANAELGSEHARRLADARPGPHVLVTVSDVGTGMDEATRARAFEPFFTTKPQGRGTGLGLATVYGIVTQSGGAVEVESEPGLGTTFRVWLPRHAGERAAAAPALTALTLTALPSGMGSRTPGAAPGAAAAAGSGATVLVAEDDPTVALVARWALEEHGYAVHVAGNGREALERLAGLDAAGEVVHLVITDLVMPELGGRALGERLAATRPELPVLYMSGYTADAVNQQAVLPPGAAFLGKPFRTAELLEHVRRLLLATAA